jgi:hypothetical protein
VQIRAITVLGTYKPLLFIAGCCAIHEAPTLLSIYRLSRAIGGYWLARIQEADWISYLIFGLVQVRFGVVLPQNEQAANGGVSLSEGLGNMSRQRRHGGVFSNRTCCLTLGILSAIKIWLTGNLLLVCGTSP